MESVGTQTDGADRSRNVTENRRRHKRCFQGE